MRVEVLAAAGPSLRGLSRLTLQLGGLRNQAAIPALAQLSTLTALHLLEPPREDKWVVGQGFSCPPPVIKGHSLRLRRRNAFIGHPDEHHFHPDEPQDLTQITSSVALDLSALEPLAPRLRELVLGPRQHPACLCHLALLSGLVRLELRGGLHPGAESHDLAPLSALRNLTELVLLQPNPRPPYMARWGGPHGGRHPFWQDDGGWEAGGWGWGGGGGEVWAPPAPPWEDERAAVAAAAARAEEAAADEEYAGGPLEWDAPLHPWMHAGAGGNQPPGRLPLPEGCRYDRRLQHLEQNVSRGWGEGG